MDPSGTQRAEIFYKATPYDRRAFLRVVRARPQLLRRFLGSAIGLLAAVFAFAIAAGLPTAITMLSIPSYAPRVRDFNQWPLALYFFVFGPIVVVGLAAAVGALVFVETAPGYEGLRFTGRRRTEYQGRVQ